MIDPADEERLLAALRGADRAARDAAARELHERLAPMLQQLCVRVTGDFAEAEDAVQQTFVDLLRGIAGFRGGSRLSTWIYRIAIRAALRVRSRGRRHRHEPLAAEPAHGETPDRAAAERENAARLLRAIDRLPAPLRAVLGLAALQGLEQRDVAEVLGVPVGTVWSRLHEARTQLAAELRRENRG